MKNSSISWTQDTWNCTSGCSREMAEGAITSGCGDPTGGGCYAEAMAYRFSGPGQWAEGLVRKTPNGPRWTGVVRLEPDRLDRPLRWRGNRLIFVCSTSDPFHPKLKNHEIAAIYGAMAATGGRHIFQMLTKRARRRREWFVWVEREAKAAGLSQASLCFMFARKLAPDGPLQSDETARAARAMTWPLPHVWEGASIEHQRAANDRIPDLLETPAALRWVSAEPLIGAIDFTLHGSQVKGWDEDWKQDTLSGAGWARPSDDEIDVTSARINWVVAGCESGRNARPAQLTWFRDIRDQCAAARVPFFLKQAMHTPGEYVEGMSATLLIGADTLSRPKGQRVRDGQPQLVELPTLDGRYHADIPGRHIIQSSPDAITVRTTWGQE